MNRLSLKQAKLLRHFYKESTNSFWDSEGSLWIDAYGFSDNTSDTRFSAPFQEEVLCHLREVFDTHCFIIPALVQSTGETSYHSECERIIADEISGCSFDLENIKWTELCDDYDEAFTKILENFLLNNERIRMPALVRKFVYEFDEGYKVKPFSFEITLPCH